MSGEKEPPEDEITKRLQDSEPDTLEMPSEPPTVKLTTENSNTEVEILRLRLRDEETQRQRAEERARQLETEKAQIRAELVEAKYKTGELTHPNLLDELEEQILITIGEQGGSCNVSELKSRFGYNLHKKGKQQINQVTLDRYLSKLKEKGHITSNDSRSVYEQVTYTLTDNGRDYLIDNKLL